MIPLHSLSRVSVQLAVLMGLLNAASVLPAQATDPTPAEKIFATPRPLVIAHRGYCDFAPENTLPAFQLGLQAGADLVELDYHHTKDGVPVVIHDADLDRTTDAVARWGGSKLRVADRTLAELTTLDAGKWFSPNFAGTKLPTLAEAVNTIQAHPGGMTLIERKAGDAATCVKFLREAGLVNQLVVQSFDWNYLRDFHQLEPRQILGALGPPSARNGQALQSAEKVLTPQWVDEASATGAKVVVWNSQITSEAVAYAHGKGLKVWVYTINDPAKAEALLDQGVDGIITNNTALIWKTLALRRK